MGIDPTSPHRDHYKSELHRDSTGIPKLCHLGFHLRKKTAQNMTKPAPSRAETGVHRFPAPSFSLVFPFWLWPGFPFFPLFSAAAAAPPVLCLLRRAPGGFLRARREHAAHTRQRQKAKVGRGAARSDAGRVQLRPSWCSAGVRLDHMLRATGRFGSEHRSTAVGSADRRRLGGWLWVSRGLQGFTGRDDGGDALCAPLCLLQ